MTQNKRPDTQRRNSMTQRVRTPRMGHAAHSAPYACTSIGMSSASLGLTRLASSTTMMIGTPAIYLATGCGQAARCKHKYCWSAIKSSPPCVLKVISFIFALKALKSFAYGNCKRCSRSKSQKHAQSRNATICSSWPGHHDHRILHSCNIPDNVPRL